MALRRDRNGNATSESYVTDAQQKAREREAHRLEYTARVRRENRVLRSKRSASQQLAVLDAIHGKGKGAVKERARLQRETNHATASSIQAQVSGGANP